VKLYHSVHLTASSCRATVARDQTTATRRRDRRDARRGLILAGGGTHDDWYVVERAITVDEFIEIVDLDTNDIMTLMEGRGKEIRK
jgi:hypothetical protein